MEVMYYVLRSTNINPIFNKEKLPQQWKESIGSIYKKDDKIYCNNSRSKSLLSAIYNNFSTSFFKINFTVVIGVDLDVIYCIRHVLNRNVSAMGQYVSCT